MGQNTPSERVKQFVKPHNAPTPNSEPGYVHKCNNPIEFEAPPSLDPQHQYILADSAGLRWIKASTSGYGGETQLENDKKFNALIEAS